MISRGQFQLLLRRLRRPLRHKMTAFIVSFLVKLALSYVESKATSILKKDAPEIVTRLTNVAANIKTYHEVSDYPTGRNGA